MKLMERWAVGLCACLLAGSAWCQAVTVADVKYDATSALGDTALQLNGAGVRYKAVFKVYTAGLYLEKKASTPQEVAALLPLMAPSARSQAQAQPAQPS
eukprot:gene40537-50143_t